MEPSYLILIAKPLKPNVSAPLIRQDGISIKQDLLDGGNFIRSKIKGEAWGSSSSRIFQKEVLKPLMGEDEMVVVIATMLPDGNNDRCYRSLDSFSHCVRSLFSRALPAS